MMTLIKNHHLPLLLAVTLLSLIGVAMLYSAAGGAWQPWALTHAVRLVLGLGIMMLIASRSINQWHGWAYPLYGVTILLLLAVFLFGDTGMGARRWLDFDVLRLQPSELLKVSLVLLLARFFHDRSRQTRMSWSSFVIPLALIFIPAALIAIQPDLGTAILLVIIGIVTIYMAGVSSFKFMLMSFLALLSAPFAWSYLHDYQKRRLLAFLDPEQDPLGAGYHAIQSKIALGSGGFWGRGFLQGPQSHLDFLPEKQTDFIFTMYAEEMGFSGAIFLLLLYTIVMASGFYIAFACRHHFGVVISLGVTTAITTYVVVNIGMVSGLLPVVGAPLPFLSYGGSSMITLFVGVGLLMNVWIHRDQRVGAGLS